MRYTEVTCNKIAEKQNLERYDLMHLVTSSTMHLQEIGWTADKSEKTCNTEIKSG